MDDIKVLFGTLGVFCAFLSYIFYFPSIRAGKTKPHAFSWLVWSCMAFIVFLSQVKGGAEAGSWVLGFSMCIDLLIFFIALRWGEKRIVLIDYICLAGACIAMALWPLTGTPLWSVLVAMLVDALGFAPTFRKTFIQPYSENISMYVLSATKFVFVLGAIEEYSIITALYPAWVLMENVLFAGMVIIRRKIHANATNSITRISK